MKKKNHVCSLLSILELSIPLGITRPKALRNYGNSESHSTCAGPCWLLQGHLRSFQMSAGQQFSGCEWLHPAASPPTIGNQDYQMMQLVRTGVPVRLSVLSFFLPSCNPWRLFVATSLAKMRSLNLGLVLLSKSVIGSSVPGHVNAPGAAAGLGLGLEP